MRTDFVSTTEAAKILGVSRIAVFNKIRTGKIGAEKIGRNFIIRKNDVLRAAGELLTEPQKKNIDKAVSRAVRQYGGVFKRLGKE